MYSICVLGYESELLYLFKKIKLDCLIHKYSKPHYMHLEKKVCQRWACNSYKADYTSNREKENVLLSPFLSFYKT